MTDLWTRDPNREWHWDEDPLVFYASSPDHMPYPVRVNRFSTLWGG